MSSIDQEKKLWLGILLISNIKKFLFTLSFFFFFFGRLSFENLLKFSNLAGKQT